MLPRFVLAPALVLAFAPAGSADPGKVLFNTKLSSTQGGIPPLPDFALYGVSVCSLGDVDQDGIGDLAVGAYVENDGGPERGAVYVHFLKPDGSVKATQKISSTQGNFTGQIEDGDGFGNSLASLGDFDGDGAPDVAIGSWLDDDGGCCPGADRGAIYLVMLKTDGTVKSWTKISSTQGNLPAILIDDGDRFAQALCSMGDFDDDGVVDLGVGALYDGDSKQGANLGLNTGAVYILRLTPQGTVKGWSKISNLHGGLQHTLKNEDRFGFSMTSLGDVNGDGTTDIAVGAVLDQDGGMNAGAAYVLMLNTDGSVRAEVKLTAVEGGADPPYLLGGWFEPWDFIGHAVANAGDLDGDGVVELALSSIGDDDGGDDPLYTDKGAIYLLSLTKAGTVARVRKISQVEGDFTGVLPDACRFGESLANLDDFNHDGFPDLAIGALGDDDGGILRGAAWVVSISDQPWTWLGEGLPAAGGLEPHWFGQGTLEPGMPTTLALTKAAPGAFGLALFSAGTSYTPLLGGTLVPKPAGVPCVLLPLTTSDTGSLTLRLPWPAGLASGAELYSQVWIADPSGPFGATASNALKLLLP